LQSPSHPFPGPQQQVIPKLVQAQRIENTTARNNQQKRLYQD
jgi:hypothetical protein